MTSSDKFLVLVNLSALGVAWEDFIASVTLYNDTELLLVLSRV